MADLNKRLIIAQSWWVGSELIRRHPDLALIETHPGGGQYDCLSIVRPNRDGTTGLIDLNREGQLHVHVGGQIGFMSWEQERDHGDRHGAVKRLEAAAGLPAPQETPSSTPATLTFRVLSRTLSALLNEREDWDARSQWVDTSGWIPGPRFDLSAFPSAVDAIREQRPTDPYGIPEYRFWVLTRGDTPMVVLDTDGRVHLSDGSTTSLPNCYVRTGRRLMATIGATLGAVLP